MATATASLVLAAATVSRTQKRMMNKAVQVRVMGGYQGLRVHNSLATMGMPVTADQAFADFVSVLRAPTRGKRRGSAGLSAQCSAVAEIFKIAAIMNGLTLVGVAVGFVLLRIEAFVEESEE